MTTIREAALAQSNALDAWTPSREAAERRKRIDEVTEVIELMQDSPMHAVFHYLYARGYTKGEVREAYVNYCEGVR